LGQEREHHIVLDENSAFLQNLMARTVGEIADEGLFESVKVKVHGRHETEGRGIGLKGGKQIRGDHGCGNAVEVDEDVDRTNDAENDPAMRIEGFCFRFSLHGECPKLAGIMAQIRLEKQFQKAVQE
jgi:hypothetical protein